MKRKLSLTRFFFFNSPASLHHSCPQMKEKFFAMQNLLEEFSKLRAREVVELQGQVKVLEEEVEHLERRRELRLEEGELIICQKCCK